MDLIFRSAFEYEQLDRNMRLLATTDHQIGLAKSCRRSHPVTFNAVELTIAVFSMSLSPAIKPITLCVYCLSDQIMHCTESLLYYIRLNSH